MRRGTSFWGVILIIVGGLLLLNNLGIFNVDIWGAMWSLILIAFGFWLLIGVVGRGDGSPRKALSIPLDGASQVKVMVRHGAGRLSIRGGANEDVALSGNFDGGVEERTYKSGDALEVNLDAARSIFGIFPFAQGNFWSISLNEQTPISLDVRAGANETTIDLRAVKITDLVLKTGASSTELTLPAMAGFTRAKVESGVAAVRVRVPDGVAASIRATGGLAEIKVDSSRFPHSGDRYQSADYDSAENRVELDLTMGVGSLDVR